MACASSLLSEEQFLCPICLDVFTDPVGTPCGHNYCKTCITHYWDRSDRCECPICKEAFDKRPDLRVNTFISEMVARFRKSSQGKVKTSAMQEPAEPNEVPCDICTETKLEALKSCLVCMTSYCETHLEPHQRVTGLKRHKLVEPLKNLEDCMCKKHDRPLELFCKTDQMCVCQFCTESDHKLHEIASLKEAYDGKKAELGKTEAEVQQMIWEKQLKIEEVIHSVQLGKKNAALDLSAGVRVFTAMVRFIKRCQAELMHVIEEKQKTVEKQAEDFINELKQEVIQLEKRSSELKQLSQTEDHLHFLQNFPSINTPPPTKDWTNVNVPEASYLGTVSTAVARLKSSLVSWATAVHPVPTNGGDELSRIQQYAVDVTLDPDTAHGTLILSGDGKRVSYGETVAKNLPDNTKRFSLYANVFGKQSFSSGRFYYEVQVKEKTGWTIGVARESIDRKSKGTTCPREGYWTMLFRNNEYQACDGPAVILPVTGKVQKVGVYVDYDWGRVSFYDVEARVNLYSFTGCTFTEELHPFFNPSLNTDGKNAAPLIISPVNHTG